MKFKDRITPQGNFFQKWAPNVVAETGKEGKTKEVVEDPEVNKVVCVTKLYVKDGVWQRKMMCVCDKVVCERWCVCVSHLERCKTSIRFFLICRGAISCLQLIAQRRGLHSWLIWLRDAGVTYLPTVSEMGRGSTQEPPCRPFETSIYCTVVEIWNQF